MSPLHQAQRVRIYICEDDRWHGHTLYRELLERLRIAGAAGTTVFRGAAGFGVHQRTHSTMSELSSLNLPVVVEWIDTPERVERLLPMLSEMVSEGMITVEPVTVVKFAYRNLRPLAADRTVGEVMTANPVTVREDAPVRELVELLVRRNYRALPVVDATGRIVGIVTNGDLIERGGLGLRAELLPMLDPNVLESELGRIGANGKTAADIMTREVVTVRPETDLRSAAHLMTTQRLKRLPVVDAQGHVLGIVARVDILRTVGEHFPVIPPPEPSGQPPEAPAVPAFVRGVMTRDVPLVSADAPLPEVLDAIVSTRLNCAVVVDAERRPLGIVTDAELMRRIDPAQHPSVGQVLMRKLPFVHLTPEQKEALRSQTGTRAGDLMISPIVTVTAATPVGEAIRRMLERKYKILPVVDAEGRVVGMIDRADLLRAVV